MSRPRVIRKVTKMGRDGRPKVARDRREGLQIERVKAQADRPCALGLDCHQRRAHSMGGVILKDWEYAKITDAHGGRRFRGGVIPDVKDYHFACVPLRALPMVRFFLRDRSMWHTVRDGRLGR